MVATTVNGMKVAERELGSELIWSGSVTVRVRPWPDQPTCGFLVITAAPGQELVLPDSGVIDGWLDTLAASGFSHVRTNALTPPTVQRLLESGFSVAQDLALLQRQNSAATSGSTPQTHTVNSHTVRIFSGRLVPSLFGRADSVLTRLLDIDHAAFAQPWRLDRTMLTEALSSTNRCRIFVSTSHGQATGFILVGVSAQQGYIQRLAVVPAAQRTGTASHLLTRALAWIDSQGCDTSIVNTDIHNTAALALYRTYGFVSLEHGLTVVERKLQ